MLELKNVSVQFGGLKAVNKVSFTVNQGQIFGLIGPNGAGKTTVFNLITGVYCPTEGEVYFKGQALKNIPPYQIARLGLVRTFQNIRLFKQLTVLENVLTGFCYQASYGLIETVSRLGRYQQNENNFYEQAIKLLEMFELENKKNYLASELSYGEQRKLEIIRALASQPDLICLDEPAAGMNHSETLNLMSLIKKIKSELSVTILLIEHDMKLIMGISDEIVVLNYGAKICQGNPDQVKTNQEVIKAYLGVNNENNQ